MNIEVINLGDVSKENNHKRKFVLLDDGRLIFGKVQWHKNLVEAAGIDNPIVIGAGVVPEDLISDTDDAWGEWKSTGYEIVTSPDFREAVKTALRAAS